MPVVSDPACDRFPELSMGLLLAARIRLEEQRAALDELYLAAED